MADITAQGRFGLVVPLCAWAVIADVALLVYYAQP
jgi:hypothetical protein